MITLAGLVVFMVSTQSKLYRCGETSKTDIEALLSSRRYALGRAVLKAMEPVDRLLFTTPRQKWFNLRHHIGKWLTAGKK
jgi:hypothetical protein